MKPVLSFKEDPFPSEWLAPELKLDLDNNNNDGQFSEGISAESNHLTLQATSVRYNLTEFLN